MQHLGMRHHKGFAFVVLKSQKDLACILDMHKTDGIYIDGFPQHKLNCKFANQTQDMPEVNRKREEEARKKSNEDQLFVGALPWAANEQDVREFCDQHGTIDSCSCLDGRLTRTGFRSTRASASCASRPKRSRTPTSCATSRSTSFQGSRTSRSRSTTRRTLSLCMLSR